MAILDAQHLFSDAQALTATAVSTNVIDFGSDRNIGVGEPMAVLLSLDVAADNTTGDETYSVAVQTDDNVGFTSALALGTVAIPAGSAAGTRRAFVLPVDETMERFLRLNYTLAGTTPTVTVTAALVPVSHITNATVYPDGFTITG